MSNIQSSNLEIETLHDLVELSAKSLEKSAFILNQAAVNIRTILDELKNASAET